MKKNTLSWYSPVGVLILVLAGSLLAQDPSSGHKTQKTDKEYIVRSSGPGKTSTLWVEKGPGIDGGMDVTVQFMISEVEHDGKIVKGVPYSAEAVTESVQTLGDGNRITHKSTTMTYRDSEGRTRREQTLTQVGAWTTEEEPLVTIFINDPVAQISYVLYPKEKVARKFTRPRMEIKKDLGPSDTVIVMKSGGERSPGAPMEFTRKLAGHDLDPGGEFQKEVLGKQTIEGIMAEGTKTTVTIPAGKIGNELPIHIVTESWYSPELQTLVLNRHLDPRMGETSFRLNGITRAEPARSLFEVPADYRMEEGLQRVFIHKKQK